MKPIIGILTRPYIRDNGVKVDAVTNMNRRAILKNGGIPIGLLPTQDLNYIELKREDTPLMSEEEKNDIIKQLDLCDGVLLQGGNRWYEYDEFVMNYIIEKNIPCLAICMSMQLLSFTDLKKEGYNYENREVQNHKSDEEYKHTINIKDDSVLYKILGKNVIPVNSSHKYAITKTSKAKFIATAPDGVIEAIEYPGRFILGLQWHPEKLIDVDNDANEIFKYFIKICTK